MLLHTVWPSSSHARAWLAAAFTALLVACDPGFDGDARRDRSGGPESAPALQLEAVVTVPGEVASFGRVEAIVADTAGRMYLADTQAQEIHVFEADGARAGTLGGPGEGPGEFAGLSGSLAWIGGDLLTLDWRNPRVSVLETSGATRATRPWPIIDGNLPSRLFSGNEAAFGVAQVRGAMRMIHRDQEPPPWPAPELIYYAFAPDGSSRPLAALQDTTTPWPPAVPCMSSDRMHSQTFRFPFTGRGPLRAFLPTGDLAMADPKTYTIDIVDAASGEVIRSIQRDVEPLPVLEEHWLEQPEARNFAQFEEAYGGPLLYPGGAPCPFYTTRPEHLPVIRTLVADEAGRLWVETTAEDGFLLALFDVDGQLLGEAPMPERDDRVAPYARGNLLYLVTRDTLDVQGIEVYRASPVR